MASVDMSLDDEMAGDRIDFPDAGFPVDSGLDSDCDLDLSDTIDDVPEHDANGADVSSGPAGSFSHEEKTQMIHLRSHLNGVNDAVDEKTKTVEKTREEMRRCQEQIHSLEIERDATFSQIQQFDEEGNVSATNRLRATHQRLCEEIRNEQELEVRIHAILESAEYELAQLQVEQGKYQTLDAELQQREASWEKQRQHEAAIRVEKEHTLIKNSEKKRRQQEKAREKALKQREEQLQKRIEDAEKSHQKHDKFLQETMNKMRARSAEESKREKEHMERRMNTLLSLKSDIADNRENMKAQQARDRAAAKERNTKDEAFKKEVASVGGKPPEELIKKNVIEEYEKTKQSFYVEQKEKQVEIAARILEEQKQMKRRKQLQPHLYPDAKAKAEKIVKPHPKPKLKSFEEYRAAQEAKMMSGPELAQDRGQVLSDDEEEDAHAASGDPEGDVVLHSSEDEESADLAKPEFEGLWNKHKPYKVPKERKVEVKLPGASKMEQEIMQRNLEKQKDKIVTKQVVGGKEFKGKAFNSKPEIIHFKDFDVGKTYKKRVTLTNVSYTVNHLKLIGVTDQLKDFVDIHYDPPGQMSAGLTCDMVVFFKPMINEDLLGEVQFLAQTGPFSVPVRCTTKKCSLNVDTSVVDFGAAVIGETLKRTITLRNSGALGTTFKFQKVSDMKQREATSPQPSPELQLASDEAPAEEPDDAQEVIADREVKSAETKEQDEEKPLDRPAGDEADPDQQERLAEETTRSEDGTRDEDTVGRSEDKGPPSTGRLGCETQLSEPEDFTSVDGLSVVGVSKSMDTRFKRAQTRNHLF